MMLVHSMIALRLTPVRCIALALCLLHAPTFAQPVPSPAPDAMRAELERVQAAAPSGLPPAVWTSIAYQLDVADRIQKDYSAQAAKWRARARSWLERAGRGEDPLVAARGQIVMRGYDSPISKLRQGYAIYLPKDFDPNRAYPLMIALHGGSANGNLFLGVVLGNNMNWKEYDRHLWDDFTPKWSPDWIVVAPDGFGQVMWRFMGEQDVLDVIADVQKHYKIDDDRVVLAGLSNGGVGAYSLGMRHAWRFSAVLAIAGAPSWLQYARSEGDPLQAAALHPISGMSLAENAINTDFRFFHGHSDPGPMRPQFVEEFARHIGTLGVPYREKWFDTGHDLLYLVMRQGQVFSELATPVRNRRPKEVRLVTGDYRANRQHWVTVTKIQRFPELARVRAVAEGDVIRVETKNTQAVTLGLADAPLTPGNTLRIEIDGMRVFEGSRQVAGATAELYRDATGWHLGKLPRDGLTKRPGVSGPITDAYFGAIAHVYGTGDVALASKLKRSAERGAKGWPLWLWRVEQLVVADSEVDDALLRTHHLVLYGTPGTNSLLTRIQDRLPIRVDAGGVSVGEQRFSGAGVGTRFVYPNPLSPERYVIVQAAPTADGVQGGHNLPDFLPDFVVYDAKSTRSRPRLLFGGNQRPLGLGYFDGNWRVDPTYSRNLSTAKAATAKLSVPAKEGDGPESALQHVPRSKLPVPASPPAPPPPQQFAAGEDTQAGQVAREIAKRVQTFDNYRSKIPGATWTVDQASVWSIRDEASCLASLPALGVDVETWPGKLATPVPVPVRIRGAIDGVTFRFSHANARQVVSCELAARFADVARIVKRHGVHTVYVMSAYRDNPYPSFHTLGLALDISRFDTADGALEIKSDFTIERNRETCDKTFPPPRGKKAQKLLDIACDLAGSRRFSSVLTPNYNAGHRDHFHVDIRPDDPRFFVR